MDWNRILSGLVAAIFVIAAFAGDGSKTGFTVVAFVALPLACIWYSDAMGDFIGQSGSGYINESSPGWLVCILGWLLLLMPIVVGIVLARDGSQP